MKSTGYKVRFLPIDVFRVKGWIEGSSPGEIGLSLFVDDRLEGHGLADAQQSEAVSTCGFSIEIPAHLRDGRVHKISVRLRGDDRDIGHYPLITVIDVDAATDSRRAVAVFAGELAFADKPLSEAPGILKSVAPYRARIERSMRGRCRMLLQGWASWPDGSALASNIRLRLLGKAPVQVPREGFHQDFVSFSVVFDLGPKSKWPSSILMDTGAGTAEQILSLPPPEISKVAGYLNIRENMFLGGYCVGLDEDRTHAEIRLAGDVELSVPLHKSRPGLVFDSHGVVPAQFSAELRDHLFNARTRNHGFALEDGILTAELVEDGKIYARSAVNIADPVRLQVEQTLPERLTGWMVNSHHPDRIVELDVIVDGIRLRSVRADQHRQDVIASGLTDQGGGFKVVPAVLGAGEHVWQFVHPFTNQYLGGAYRISVTDRQPSLRNIYGLPGAFRPVTIVVALTAHQDMGREALERLRARTPYVSILVLAVPAAAKALEGVEGVDCKVLSSPSLQAAVDLTGNDDIIWIEGLPEVAAGWLDGLRTAAYSDPRIATVTPLSDCGQFAVPEGYGVNPLPEGLTFEQMSRQVRQAATGSYPRVFAGDPACLYLRRDGLLSAASSGVDFGNIFSCASQMGLTHVVDDRTFIKRAVASPIPEMVFESDAMAAVRWRIRGGMQSGTVPKPRILYVISTQGGGTPQTNRDLMEAIGDRFEPWVLTSDSQTLELYQFLENEMHLVEKVTLETPVNPVFHTSPEYDDWVAYVMIRYAFEAVHIRHLGWHGTGLPKVARRLGIPVVLSIHDYYMVCPNTKLLDPANVYCGGACTTGADDCASELWPQSDFPRLRDGFVHRWREIFVDAFAACNVLVTTSESVREVFQRIYPSLRSADFRVIPHGRNFSERARLAVTPASDTPLKILVPGNISPAKGADLINALVALDVEGILEFHMLGDAGWIIPSGRVTRHGIYERKDFPRLVEAIAPHIGLVPSLCPETFCHTLTEMWAGGLPVAGLDLGAVGERIRSHEAGWLLPANGDAEAIFDILKSIREDREGWQSRERAVLNWQTGEGLYRSVTWMGGEYEALYRGLLGGS